jgi:hypothetical protein
MREQWQAEAVARSLGDPEPMPVRWRLSDPALTDDPRVVNPEEPLVFSGRSDRMKALAAAFRRLPRRRLVIIGGPGTGKTALAVQLLLERLPAPGQPPAGPVPVLLSLAGWNPASTPRVQDWVTEQLEQIYPALRAISLDAAAGLVAQGRVLPVLDGLDEVPPERAAAVVTALNTSLDVDGGLILTSRRAEYRDAIRAAGDTLTGAAVVASLALTSAEAAVYLHKQLASPRPSRRPGGAGDARRRRCGEPGRGHRQPARPVAGPRRLPRHAATSRPAHRSRPVPRRRHAPLPPAR